MKKDHLPFPLSPVEQEKKDENINNSEYKFTQFTKNPSRSPNKSLFIRFNRINIKTLTELETELHKILNKESKLSSLQRKIAISIYMIITK